MNAKNPYTWCRNFEKRYPTHIFNLDYDKLSRVGTLTVRPVNHVRNHKTFEMIYSQFEKRFLFFDKETGKKVTIWKEVRKLK